MRTRALNVIVLCLAIIATSDWCLSQDTQIDRLNQLDDLMEEFNSAMIEYRSIPKAERRYDESPYRVFPHQILEFAKQYNDEASFRASKLLLRHRVKNSVRPPIELVMNHHINNSGIGDFMADVIRTLHYSDDPDKLISKMLDSDLSRTRIYGKYSLAKLMIARRDSCIKGNTQTFNGYFIEHQVAQFNNDDVRSEIIDLLEDVVEHAVDLSYLNGRLIDFAKEDLNSIVLEVGVPAPEVAGRDSDGNAFALSDLHEKVVVITFWATWCGPCMKALPDEISFVKEMKDTRLAWIGVNCDEEVSQLRDAIIEHDINFRNWHDGINGPIAAQWGVRSLPVVIVIDSEGIIRYKTRGVMDFEKVKSAVNSLVDKTDDEKN